VTTSMWLSMTAMWTAMMVPMMLPSLVPRFRSWRPRLALIAAGGYFLVWAVCGALVYPPTMLWSFSRYAGVVVIVAGLLQLTRWKMRELAKCRMDSCPPDVQSAWRRGLRMGVDCTLCCASYMIVLLVVGAMNIVAMIAITAAITIERLAPRPALFARLFGVCVIGTGAFMLAP
jgi:predicted metal-binding membrane protein